MSDTNTIKSIPQFTINHYKNLNASTHIATEKLNFDELVHYLEKFEVSPTDKYKAGLFVAGDMKYPYRNNENIINKSLLTLDYDDIEDGTDLIETIKDCINFSFVLYSTFNSTKDNLRLRLVIPLSKPIETKYYMTAIQLIEDALQVKCDPKSYVISQAMGLQTLKTADSHRVFEVNDTHILDTDGLMQIVKQRSNDKPVTTGATFRKDDSHWDIAYGGLAEGENRNVACTSLVGMMLRRYVPLKVTVAMIEHWNNSNIDPLSEKELTTIINSVVKIETKRRGGEGDIDT